MDARTPLQPAIVTPKQALSIKPFGLEMRVLLSTDATGGAISVIMAWHKPGEGPPDHVHFSQEEMFFIVEGTYELTVGGETSTVGPGTIVFIPRNVVHRFRNVGDATRRRRLHRREGDGDKQEVRHELHLSSLSCMAGLHCR
jgi:mannose-6-phosphate isomerase-like protein (cupin superfamily)